MEPVTAPVEPQPQNSLLNHWKLMAAAAVFAVALIVFMRHRGAASSASTSTNTTNPTTYSGATDAGAMTQLQGISDQLNQLQQTSTQAGATGSTAPGTTQTSPPQQQTQPPFSQPLGAPASSPMIGPASAPSPPPNQPRFITVRVTRWPSQDSTLSGIANQYHVPGGWSALWHFGNNYATVGPNPNRLYVGENIQVPQ